MNDGYGECEAVLQRDDPDRALAVAFAPPDRRPHLAALYAFDIETARVRQIVSQPLPGEIRLQWWRDRIAAYVADPMETGGQGSPLAGALLETIAACDLPVPVFEILLEARIFDLYDDPMPDRTTFETYAGETASAVTMLAAMILDRAAAPAASEVAGHAGVAGTGLEAMRLYRRRPQHAQIFFPTDLLDAVGCERDALLDPAGEPAVRAVAALAAFARGHLAAARGGLAALPRSLRPAFLPLERIDGEIRRLQRSSGLEGTGRMAVLDRTLRYWRASRR